MSLKQKYNFATVYVRTANATWQSILTQRASGNREISTRGPCGMPLQPYGCSKGVQRKHHAFLSQIPYRSDYPKNKTMARCLPLHESINCGTWPLAKHTKRGSKPLETQPKALQMQAMFHNKGRYPIGFNMFWPKGTSKRSSPAPALECCTSSSRSVNTLKRRMSICSSGASADFPSSIGWIRMLQNQRAAWFQSVIPF